MRPTRQAIHTLAAGLLLTAALAACGDDDETSTATEAPPASAAAPTATQPSATEPPSTEPPPTEPAATEPPSTEPATSVTEPDAGDPSGDAAGIPGGTADVEFCEGFVALEQGVAAAPEDPAALEAHAEEVIMPNIELVSAHAPTDLSEAVGVMTGALEGFLTSGDFAAFESPEFSAAATVVYPGLEDACGIPNIAVSAVDYSFEGVPTTTEAGIYTFLLTNNSAAGEAHELAVVKLKDGVDMPLDELLALPEEEVDPLIDTFGSGTFATPGSSWARSST